MGWEEIRTEVMKTAENLETHVRQQDIAARAYHLWEAAGHHHHRDLEYWLQAESELGAALPTGRAGKPASALEQVDPSVECVEDLLTPAW
jgi:hypothetical protein